MKFKKFKKGMLKKYVKKHTRKMMQVVATLCVLLTVSVIAMRFQNNKANTTISQNEPVSETVESDTSSKGNGEASIEQSMEDTQDDEEDPSSTSDAVIKIAGMEESTIAETLSKIGQEWQTKLIPKVEDYLVVRKDANSDAEMVGKLHKGDSAEVLSKQEGWIQIRSGNVEGYVSAEYSLLGEEAYHLAKSILPVRAINMADGLRIRSNASVDADIVAVLENGATMMVNKEAPVVEDWIAVKYKEQMGYVSDDFVELSPETGKGITIEEEQAILEEQRLAKEKEERESREAEASIEAARAAEAERIARAEQESTTAKATSSSQKTTAKKKTTENSGSGISVAASDVDMLAAIIECEAGSEGYESKLAVGAVVVNRVQSPLFPNTISEVLYQGGQFTPVAAGGFERVLARGATSSCYQAARDALAGNDNTGGCLYFRTANGRAGLIIERMVFY